MKVLHFGACIGLSILAGGTLIISAIIGNATRASETPLWTKTCTIHRDGAFLELLCNDYQHRQQVDALTLSALRTVYVECSAYPTRGFSNKLDVQCEDPSLRGPEF